MQHIAVDPEANYMHVWSGLELVQQIESDL